MTLILCVLVGLSGCASEPRRRDAPESTRSRIGQIVDADTGQPIVGALVLEAFYLWPERGFGNFPVPKVFRDSAEASSDENGRFTIPGPYDDRSWGTDETYIFKAGYGPWRFRGQTDTGRGTKEAAAWLKNAWQQFTTDGMVIELRPLRTRQERLKYIERGWDPSDRLEPGFSRATPFGSSYFFDVPADRLSAFQHAVDAERSNLALAPRRLDGHRQAR
jgi:hypothetical protein